MQSSCKNQQRLGTRGLGRAEGGIVITSYYSIDVESWAHSSRPSFAALSTSERKCVDGGATAWQVRRLLALLKKLDLRLTFFITGEVFDWHPLLIDEIAQDGHEIGFHSQDHHVLSCSEDLEKEIVAARRFIASWQPAGFRAPAMGMVETAYEVLRESGFVYSSSVYASCDSIPINGVVEIPVSTQPWSWSRLKNPTIPAPMSARLWAREIPYGSGYVLGLLGWRNVHAIMESRAARGLPSNLFVHNWQLYWHDRRSFSHQYIEALRNPLHFPYARVIGRDFIELCRRHSFSRLDTHPAIRDRLRDSGQPRTQVSSLSRL